MTPQLLAAALQVPLARSTPFAAPIAAAMARYAIDTPARQAAFLAQCGHESGRLQWLRELWGPTPAQRGYEPPAAKAHELGNTQAGDGFLFRGGGLLQITGRYNFTIYGQKIGLDLGSQPELIGQPATAALVSAQWWSDHGLNALADAGDFLGISRTINLGSAHVAGTPNGMPDRLALWASCKAALDAA